jgi:hypothetical protein
MGTKSNVGFAIFLMVCAVFYMYWITDNSYYETYYEYDNETIFNGSLVPPEVILTNNLSIVCVSGYSETVRNVPSSVMKDVYERDNITKSTETAVDHIIPLCLGGSNHIDNLRAMYVVEKVKKDNLERYLCNSHVCDGDININYAHAMIFANWQEFYKEIFGEVPLNESFYTKI